MPRRRRGSTLRRNRPVDVFLNIPYDEEFEHLYLAYIAGISAFGLIPRATLELKASVRRLDRILRLVRSCDFAIHDLSRVQLDRTPPSTPRFNMPFELGLSVAWERLGRGLRGQAHEWFVFESKRHRCTKSLSDLNGTDVFIHEGTIRGVFRELCNAFASVKVRPQPSVQQMWRVYRVLRNNLPRIMDNTAAGSPFGARVFKDLCFLASASADQEVI